MEAAAALSSPEQRKQFCLWEGVSSGELRRYAEAVKENDQRLKPKQLLVERVTADEPAAKKRRPMSARRLSGGGRHHRSYYSGGHFRFPMAVGDRDREEGEEEKEVDTEVEDGEMDRAEERGTQSWEVVQEVPLDMLYDVVSPPPGVLTGRLRLHPQALLIVR